MVEARSLHVIVSSDHPSADEQVAEAIARVASRYAVDLTPEIEVNVPQAGITVPYVGKAALRFSSRLRAAIRARGGSRSWMAKHQSAPASSPPLRELRKSSGCGSKSLSGRPQTNKRRNRSGPTDLKCVSALPCSIRYSELDDVP